MNLLNYNRSIIGFNSVDLNILDPEKVYNSFPIELKEAIFNKKPIKLLNKKERQNAIFYSGGLESTISTLTYSSINSSFFYLENLGKFCEEKEIKFELFLIAVTYILGYNTAVLGLEFSPLIQMSPFPQFYIPFLEQFASHLDISLSIPMSWIDKFSLFKQATRMGIIFNSCDNSNFKELFFSSGQKNIYCGNCFKCYQISTFQRSLKINNPINIDITLVKKYISEHNEYLKSSIDLYGSEFSFTNMNQSLEEIWGI